jgi:hypothetical protein
MNKRERLVYVTEQRMLGFVYVFDDRWDHALALEALLVNGVAERRAFDRWAAARQKELQERQLKRGAGPNAKTGYRPVTWLVQEYLFHESCLPHKVEAKQTEEEKARSKNYKDRWRVLGQMLEEGLDARRPLRQEKRVQRQRDHKLSTGSTNHSKEGGACRTPTTATDSSS